MRAAIAQPRPPLDAHNALATDARRASSASRPTCSAGPSSPSRCCSGRCCRRATGLDGPGAPPDAAERFSAQLAASPRAPVEPADIEALRAFGLAQAADIVSLRWCRR